MPSCEAWCSADRRRPRGVALQLVRLLVQGASSRSAAPRLPRSRPRIVARSAGGGGTPDACAAATAAASRPAPRPLGGSRGREVSAGAVRTGDRLLAAVAGRRPTHARTRTSAPPAAAYDALALSSFGGTLRFALERTTPPRHSNRARRQRSQPRRNVGDVERDRLKCARRSRHLSRVAERSGREVQ